MKHQIALIPLSKKEAALKLLTEDQFRDELVRPLFLKKGFKHGEEMCGSDEEGKDCYFITTDQMGIEMLYVVQTKAGNLNMSSEASKNMQNAITQMRMLMTTFVVNTKTKHKQKANVGILCTSGKINQAARRHIQTEVGETNIRFLDSHDIITDIDELFPEYWIGISAKRNPYLISLHEDLTNSTDELSLVNILADLEITSSVTEDGYANLRLTRTFIKVEKSYGKLIQKPDFEEITGIDLIQRKKKLLLIKGEGGFGKSTLLRRIAEIESQKTVSGHSTTIPVIIRAKSLIVDNLDLTEIAARSTQKINRTVNEPAFSIDDLRHGYVLLLIDALDEVSDDPSKQIVTAKCSKFHMDFPNCRIVITSRHHSFLSRCPFFSTFEEWNVLPLELKEAQKLLNQAAKNKVIPVEKTAEILRQLNSIHGIEINPLLVTIMTATADAQRKDIPANITELFSKFSEIMLGRWDSKKGFSQQFESPLKHRLLADLALYMHSKGITSLEYADCESYLRNRLERITDSFQKTEILLDELVNRSGLLRHCETGIEFRHLLLQEYFAGCGIKNTSEVIKHLGDEWWRRAIVFYFGSNSDDGEGLLSTVTESNLSTQQERFCAALTVGLASQACYFVDIPDRIDVLKWVCQSLADNLGGNLVDTKYPLNQFLYNYLTGRDAVASEVIKYLQPDGCCEAGRSELYQFWAVAGLIETSNLEMAFKIIKDKHIKDGKLLTALYLGAFSVSKGRVSSKSDKRIADEICTYLEPYVASYRKELLKEFRSILLEVRSGKLVETEELQLDT